MRWIALITVFLIEIIVVALAANGVLSGVFKLGENPVFSLLPEAVLPVGAVTTRMYWTFLLLLPVLHVLVKIQMWRNGRSVSFKASQSDTVSLTRKAIIQCIKNELSAVEAISKHAVSIKQIGSRAIDLHIELKVRPIENIPELQARIARSVRRSLSEILGIENIRKIRIDVKAIEETKDGKGFLGRTIPIGRRLEGPKRAKVDEVTPPPATETKTDAASGSSRPHTVFNTAPSARADVTPQTVHVPAERDDDPLPSPFGEETETQADSARYGLREEQPEEIDLGSIEDPVETIDAKMLVPGAAHEDSADGADAPDSTDGTDAPDGADGAESKD